MKILFVKGHTLFSKAICWVAKEPVSHVAVEFDGLVAHSNLIGVHIVDAKQFRDSTLVLYELDVPGAKTSVDVIDALDKYASCWYDFGAFFFLGICLYLNRRFGVPMPKNNPWQNKQAFICTEFVTQVVDHKADSMITPQGLYTELKARWSK